MQVGTSSTMTVSTSALFAMTRFCVFGRSVNWVVLASFLSSCLVLWWVGVGCHGIVDYGNSKVRQCGNKNWNNLQNRHVCMCIDMQAFILVHCQGLCRYLCLSPYPWLTPSKCFGVRSSPCPLVFPGHVTCHQCHFCPLYLPPCPLYMFLLILSFLFLAVSLWPGDGLPSPPHNTVGCAKSHDVSHSTHTMPKINTNANFHTPNHAVQHGAGFTSS